MSEMNDDELHELIALAAVDALDNDELANLESILVGRPDLAADLAELRAVAAATLGEDAVERPSAGLRDNVLAAIAAEPQFPALDRLDDVGPALAAAPPPPLAPVIPMRRRRTLWAVAAAAAAVLAIAVGVLTVRDSGDSLDDRIATVVDDPGVVTIPLGGELAGLALHHGPQSGDTILVGADVPAPEGDQVYELWLLVDDAAPARVETFRPHDDGSVGVLMPDMVPPEGAAFAITVEPAGGTDAPTGSIVASS